jgi:hypothetical protein
MKEGQPGVLDENSSSRAVPLRRCKKAVRNDEDVDLRRWMRSEQQE